MLGRTGHASVAATATGGCPMRALQQFFPKGKESGKAIAASEMWRAPPMSKPSSCTPEQYNQLALDIRDAYNAGDLEAPAMLRLAFHTTTIGSAFAHGAGSNGGWIQYDEDRLAPGNAGLEDGVAALLQLRRAKCPGITAADLFTFAGSLGAELAGGPPVAWHPGRLDATGPGPAAMPLATALPDAMLNASGVWQHYGRMGLTIREAVVLTGGGHSMGGADVDATGFMGKFTPAGDSWPKPANKYFIDLMRASWTPVVVPDSGHPQYVLAPEGGGEAAATEEGVFRLPADMALREADEMAKWSEVYANDEARFVRDFQRAMQRMLQLGAGVFFELDTSYTWRGFDGKWDGFGARVAPLDDDAE